MMALETGRHFRTTCFIFVSHKAKRYLYFTNTLKCKLNLNNEAILFGYQTMHVFLSFFPSANGMHLN